MPEQKPAPYHFVPVNTKVSLTAEPQLHDVLRGLASGFGGQAQAFTGTLYCELETLTPLLPGNYQYALGSAQHGDAAALQEPVALQRVREAAYQIFRKRRAAQTPKTSEKKIIEPLLLNSQSNKPGPVLIPATQLKGMLRHSLSALLSAPMERVWEKTHSYRPNLWFAGPKTKPRSYVFLGLVTGVTDSAVTLLLFELDRAYYVPQDVEQFLPDWKPKFDDSQSDRKHYNGLNTFSSSTSRPFLSRKEKKQLDETGKIRKGENVERLVLAYYFNGIDTQGLLASRFAEQHPDSISEGPFGYNYLLLEMPEEDHIKIGYEEYIRIVPLAMTQVDFWRNETLIHLSDEKYGHLRDHPLVDAADVERIKTQLEKLRNRGILPGDVLVVELLPLKYQGQNTWALCTLGHHVYYRQRYRDTVHHTQESDYQAKHLAQKYNQLATLRDLLAPRPAELESDPSGRPSQLSAARLFFGYVGPSGGNYSPDEVLSFGIGYCGGKQTDFAQLAGRIALNHAVEQLSEGEAVGKRFLNPEHECLVPLRPLGAPKTSAVEHYLTQDKERLCKRKDAGILCTYGDTQKDESAGNLRGRKFYLHQPDAARDPKCYELLDSSQPDWQSGNTIFLTSNQAPFGRFISIPGRRFRFTLRFVNLQSWELGALLLVLFQRPQDLKTFADLLRKEVAGDSQDLQKWVNRHLGNQTRKQPLLAHKLGHGRPLGLGSVAIRLNQGRILVKQQDGLPEEAELSEDIQRRCLEAFVWFLKEKLQGDLHTWVQEVFYSWLEVHRFSGRHRSDYPRVGKSIFRYHQNLRRGHAEGRKMPKDGKKATPSGLPPL